MTDIEHIAIEFKIAESTLLQKFVH